MKKLFSILSIFIFASVFGQNQTLTGVKTFTSPPKFLNIQYSGTNTKFLTLNGSNQLMWSSLNAITPPTPTFSQVLATGNTNTSGSTHFILYSGTGNIAQFSGGSIIFGNASNGNNTTAGLAGFNNNNNDGRLADLGFAQGFRLKTFAGGGIVTLKSTNVTANRSLEYPDQSGTIATREWVKPYKEFTAVIHQSTTSAPTIMATLVNDFPSGDITFSYIDPGVYNVNSASNAFTMNKTTVFINGNAQGYACGTIGVNDDPSYFSIFTTSIPSHSNSNGGLQNAQITIRVYN